MNYYAIHVGPDWLPLGYMTSTQAKGVQIELGRVELIQFDDMNTYLETI